MVSLPLSLCVCVCVCARGWACACVGEERFSNSNRIIPSDYRILLLLKMPIPTGERFLQPLFCGTQKGRGTPPDSRSQAHQQSTLQTSVQDDNAETDPSANSPRDWFAFVDLKDAYFHIQIKNTFSKCIDAALSPLRASGMRILNYLDDWLILAQSRETLLSNIDTLLRHLESLGLCVNMQKSILIPSQSITYLGVCFDSVEMQAILSSLRHFRLGSSVHLNKLQRLLEQRHVLIRTDNMSVVSYMNHQGGTRSKPLYEQAADLLLWADRIFLSIRAAHIPRSLEPRDGHAFEERDSPRRVEVAP